MNPLSRNAQIKFNVLGQRSPVCNVFRTGSSRLLWATLIALFCGHALASSSCINSTYPQTVAAETVEGQTRLTLGKPISAAFRNIAFTIDGSLVTLSYDYFNACVIVPPTPVAFFIDLGVLLPPGEYQLRTIGRNAPNAPYDVTRPFVVQGVSESVTIPVTSQGTLVLLALLMVLTVGVAFRRER